MQRQKTIQLLGVALLAAPLLFPQRNRTPPVTLRDVSESIEELVARVRPSVVQIFSTGYARGEENEGGTNTAGLLSKTRATGSGVILDSSGYIVTNNHVIQNATKIEVRLTPGGSQMVMEPLCIAKVVGVDRDTDIAVIKIDKQNLPTLPLGDSSMLRQGQLVMAFGSPLGLEGSVSMGVVSSTDRTLRPDDLMSYVQTDAPINPGNSGGPLVDAEGRVVGINTFILTQSGGSEGIGFAVPSNTVQSVYQQLKKDGHAHRGQIGMSVQTITPIMARGLKLPRDWGVIVGDVSPDGPAAKAGMKVGDIVLTLNRRPMNSARDVELRVARMMLADTVAMQVWRGGKTVDVTVAVIEREDDPQRFADMVTPEKNLVPKLGILAIEITDKLADMLPDLRHPFGIVVAARAANAPYTGGTLEAGDVIYEINGAATVNLKDLKDKLDVLKSGDAVVLQIERRERLVFVALELE